MDMELEFVRPDEIEKRSFAIIEEELGDRPLPEALRPVVLRVIHTTADLSYYDAPGELPASRQVDLTQR